MSNPPIKQRQCTISLGNETISIYKWFIMNLWVIAWSILNLSPALAFPTESSGVALDPVRLHCRMRQQRFFSEIKFSRNSQNVLVGELDNFVAAGNHQRSFLNGSIFFDISSTPDMVYGHTGDPRGSISSFRLLRWMSNGTTEFWRYEQTEPNGSKSHVRFVCIYSG